MRRHFMLPSSPHTELHAMAIPGGPRVLALVRRAEDHPDPAVSREMAKLAAVESLRLPNGPAGNAVRAEAYGAWANTLRVCNHLDAALRTLRQAWRFHSRSEPSLGLTARLEEWAASLCRDRREFDLALACISRALALRADQPKKYARALVKKSSIQIEAGDPAGALATVYEAMQLGDMEDARLARMLVHNMAWALVDLGAVEDAMRALQDAEELPPEPGIALIDKWLRARILATESPDLAEPELRDVVEAFLAAGLPYDAALAGLELATIQPPERALETLALIRPTFVALGIRREAVASRLLQEALVDETAIDDLIPVLKKVVRCYSSPPVKTPEEGEAGTCRPDRQHRRRTANPAGGAAG